MFVQKLEVFCRKYESIAQMKSRCAYRISYRIQSYSIVESSADRAINVLPFGIRVVAAIKAQPHNAG